MKKSFTKILPLLITLLLTAILFTSCIKDEPKIENLPEDERAAAVIEKTNKQMDKANSYTAEEKISISFSLNKQNFLVEYLSTVYSTDINSDNFAETTLSEYTFYLNGVKKETSQETEGYRDETMFFSSVEGLRKSNLKSELTVEEYLQYKKDSSDKNNAPDFDQFFFSCAETSAVKQEDGSWVATFSKPNEEIMEDFSSFFEFITEVMGDTVKITDIFCEVSVTSLFLVDKMELTILLDSDSIEGAIPLSASVKTDNKNPSITVSTEYFNYDATEQPNTIKLDKYTEVPDLRKLYDVNFALDELIDKDKGSFKMDIKSTVTVANEKQTATETDICEYENSDDGFSYELYNQSNGENYIISYKNGKQTVTYVKGGAEEELQKADSTDFEQRHYIDGMLDEGNFSITNIKDFTAAEKKGNFIYTFTSIEPNQELVDSFVSSLNANNCDGDETITVVLDADGNAVKYTYDVTLTLKFTRYSTSYTAVYELSVECVYGTTLADVE